MSIFAVNELRDYFYSQGFSGVGDLGTYMQAYVLSIETCFSGGTFSGRDPRIIQQLEYLEKPVIDVARGTYGLGLNPAETLAWINTNRPDLMALTVAPFFWLATIIPWLNTLVFDAPAAIYRNMNLGDDINQIIPTLTAAQVYANVAEKFLADVTKYMRHFALDDVLDANNMVIMKGLLDLFPTK